MFRSLPAILCLCLSADSAVNTVIINVHITQHKAYFVHRRRSQFRTTVKHLVFSVIITILHICQHSVFYLKIQRFGDWIFSSSPRGTYSAETSSFYWDQLSRFQLKLETEYSLRNIVFLNERQDDG
jgi:hypothetical protein